MKQIYKEFKEYIVGISSEERSKVVKEMSDQLLEYQSIIDKHRKYLESIPTKEQRIIELNKIRNEYRNERISNY